MSLPDEPLRTRQLLQGARLGDTIATHLEGLKRLQAQVSYMVRAAEQVDMQLSTIENDLEQVRAQLAETPRT